MDDFNFASRPRGSTEMSSAQVGGIQGCIMDDFKFASRPRGSTEMSSA